MKKLLGFMLAFTMTMTSFSWEFAYASEDSNIIYLSDMNWLSQTCGSNDFPDGTSKNSAVNGNRMQLYVDDQVQTFTKGLGTHAPSEIVYDISDLNVTHFNAYAGVDYQCEDDYLNLNEGTIQSFVVEVDGNVLASSGELNPTDNAYYFDIDIPSGSSELVLRSEQGNDNYSDWVIWANAYITTSQSEIPSQPDNNLTYDKVEGNNVAFKLTNGVIHLYRNDQVIAKSSDYGSVKVANKTYSNFTIQNYEVKENQTTAFGSATSVIITLKDSSETFTKVLRYDLINDLDGVMIASTTLQAANAYTIEYVQDHKFELVDANANKIWSYNGGGEGSQSYYDTLQKVNNSFYRINKEDETAVGIPVADIYSTNGGIAIGDASLYREILENPVQGVNNTANVSIKWKSKQLKANESLLVGTSIIAVHENDYYNGLKAYASAMAKQGFKTPSNIPDTSYDLRWESWGWEGAWTIDKILGKLDELYANGIRQITLDDCWYTAAGDWELNPDKFPNGVQDMKRLTDTIHAKGMTIILWWRPMDGGRDQAFSVLAGHTQQPSKLVQEHPEYFVKNADGSFAKLAGPGAINSFNGSTGYALCPYSQGAIDAQVKFVETAMKEWGIDGFKSDYVWGVPKCYNQAHNHQDPYESTKYASNIFYKAIYEKMIEINPNVFHLLCNCGTPQDYYSFPYVTQIPTADPTSVDQTRRRVKAYKALSQDDFPITTDHNELWYPSTIGTGGLLIEKRDFTNQAQEDEYYKWLKIADTYKLHEGRHVGDLYAYGIDNYETYVVEKDDILHYAFYNDGAKYVGSGDVILKGLEPNKQYRIVDYVNNKVIATNVTSENNVLDVEVDDYLLVRALPLDGSVVYKEQLQQLYDANSNKLQQDYTQDTWVVFDEAMNNAKQVLENEKATQNEVDEAFNQLNAALEELLGINEDPKLIKENLINKTAQDVSLVSYSSQCGGDNEPEENGTGQASATIDYQENTYWHSNWQTNNGDKHTLTYDLLKEYQVSDVTFLPRQAGRNGDIHKFEVYVGNNTDYTKNTLTGEYVFANSGTLNPNEWYRAYLAKNGEFKGRYVTIRITGSYGDSGNNQFASMAEIRFYGIEKTNDVDKESLIVLYNRFKDREQENYTNASWAKVVEAIENAKKVIENSEATQSEVNVAIVMIHSAVDHLVLKGDKTALKTLIDQVTAMDTTNKTNDSVAALASALTAAEAILAKEDATQDEVDAAKDALEAAVAGLKDKPVMDFYDVQDKKAWFYGSVESAFTKGLMGATGKAPVNGKPFFEPDTPISRGMVATVLYRMAGQPKVEFKATFSDVTNAKLWYSTAITWASQANVVSGYKDGSFGPDDNITRQDLAIMLRNYAKACGLDTNVKVDFSSFKDGNKVVSYAQSAIAFCIDAKLMSGAKKADGVYLNPSDKATRAECAKMFALLDDAIKSSIK